MNPQAKEHYTNLLADVYSWMSGDISQKSEEAKQYLLSAGIPEGKGRSAIDLGAGYGIHAKALVELGYDVTAVDFSDKLLDELKHNVPAAVVVNADITEYEFTYKPDIVLCMGDTLTHLDSTETAGKLIRKIAAALPEGGMFFSSWRELSAELQGESRFIPVKSDNSRILTCFLEYTSEEYVTVHDLLYRNVSGKWEFSSGSYNKLRLASSMASDMLKYSGFEIFSAVCKKGMEHFACKKI
ncbi:MAG: class I SAM-dependent methyltransferase [Ignavibacteria bacterium]|nr:class I SAM-dependent methyltransferase [Ignavibacteria bacterium]